MPELNDLTYVNKVLGVCMCVCLSLRDVTDSESESYGIRHFF